MRLWINEDCGGSETYDRKNSILPIIRAYLIAILLITPSMQLKSEGALKQQQEAIWVYQDDDTSEEAVESMTSYEVIFKDGIRKALTGVNKISQIPAWGKHIDYYRDEWGLKWKKIRPESVQVLKFPDRFDISPRDITKPVASMVFHLWNRKFSISPDLGKIKDIYLTQEKLVVETTLFFDITYDKQAKLPDLMYKLWMTPIGKWEKSWFKWTTVIEILN